jgi:hydrogenase maturation factor
MEKIHIFHQTQRMCRLLGIDPLGLIGSGSLLICCRESICENLISDILEAGVSIECIGEIIEAGRGVEAMNNGIAAAWPFFEVDEITRLFM